MFSTKSVVYERFLPPLNMLIKQRVGCADRLSERMIVRTSLKSKRYKNRSVDGAREGI